MSKCPKCKHNYTSKAHKTRCLRQTWKPRSPRASTRRSGPDMWRVLSAPVASQSFYSDRKLEGVIQTSPSPSEVTA